MPLALVAGSVEQLQHLLEARQLEQAQRAELMGEESRVGLDHASLIPLLVELAATLARLGAWLDAEELVSRGLRISEQNNGTVHPVTGQLALMAAQLRTLRGSVGSREMAIRAKEVLDRTLGPTAALSQLAASLVNAAPTPAAAREWSTDALSSELDQGVEALRAHDPDGSIDLLTPVVSRAQESKNSAMEAYARGMLAQALFMAGRRDQAIQEVTTAISVATTAGKDDAARHFEGLRRYMESAQPGGSSTHDYSDQIRNALETAARGDTEAAFDEIQTIAAGAALAGAAEAEASARIVLGQIHGARGELALAREELKRAQELALRSGDQVAAEHIRSLLLGLGG